MATLPSLRASPSLNAVTISSRQILIMAATAILLTAFWYVVQKTALVTRSLVLLVLASVQFVYLRTSLVHSPGRVSLTASASRHG